MSIPFTAAPRSLTATAKTAIFFLKVLPTLPSRPIDWITPTPLVGQVEYPTAHGPVAAAYPLVRDHVSFLAAIAPHSSMWTLAPGITSGARFGRHTRMPWTVDPRLARCMFVL